MSREVMGLSLDRLDDPIRNALKTYQEISDNGLRFDVDHACKLEPTPTKTNSARSESEVVFRGDLIGKLYVIAFKPGDGSGSEVDYKLQDLKVDSPYPRDARIVPRKKTGIHSEGHLTIVAHKVEDPHAEPELYRGTFDLLGLDGDTIKKIGELGHAVSALTARPVTTFTVGYRGTERFSDPHAVFSIKPALQVCGFLAVSDTVHKNHPNIWDGLKPQYPNK